MQTSTFIDDWIEEALEQGIQHGIQQGRLAEKAEDVLSVLSLRNGGIPSWMKEKIRSIRDKKVLDELLRLSVTAPDRKVVEAYLRGEGCVGS